MKEKEKNNVKHNIKNIKHTTRKKSLQKKHEHKLSSFEKENHPEMDIKSIKDIKEKIDSDFPENDDRIYSDNDIWYKAISPTDKIIFTGSLKMLTSTSSIEIANGVKRRIVYGRTGEQAFETLIDDLDESFKDIKEKCKSLMK